MIRHFAHSCLSVLLFQSVKANPIFRDSLLNSISTNSTIQLPGNLKAKAIATFSFFEQYSHQGNRHQGHYRCA